MGTRGWIPGSSSAFRDDNFAASSRGTPRKPLLIRFVMKQRQSDSCKTDQEEVPTRENASEEATPLEESSCSGGFRGLPCWSVTGRRGRKAKQSAAPTGRDNEVEENAAKVLLLPPQMSPMVTESTSEGSTNLDPRLEDTEAESDSSTQNTNLVEVASSNGDVETSAYISNKDVKGKGIMSPVSAVSEIVSTWSENRIQNISEFSAATDYENEKLACSSTTTVDKKRKRRGLEIKNTSEGNGSKEGYVCNTRNKSFSTLAKQNQSILADTSSGKDGRDKETKLPHQCSVCDKAFQTGQKLGGHMRAHFQGTLSSKRVKYNAQDHGSSTEAAARHKSPDGSSSQCVNDIAPAAAAASLSEDTTKNSHTVAAASSLAAGSVMTGMVLWPHGFDLNELPREGDLLAAASSPDTPATHVMLDLTLSL